MQNATWERFLGKINLKKEMSMDQDHIHDKHCSRCGRKLTFKDWLANQGRRITAFLCAICLSFAVGTAELGFTEVAKADHPLNDFSNDAVQFILSTANTSTGISPGDLMTDFANIQKAEQPKKIQTIKENANLL